MIFLYKRKPACIRTAYVRVQAGFFILLEFLIQIPEQVGIKELLDDNSQAITELFNGGNGGTSIAATDNIVHGGLGDTAHGAQLVDGNIFLPAQLQNPLFDSFTDTQGAPPHF